MLWASAVMSEIDKVVLSHRIDWVERARPDQLPPEGDWNTWLILAGRGWGKTRVGAEDTGCNAWRHPETIWHVVAPTDNDVRYTCFEGESGLLSVIPYEAIKNGIEKGYNRSDHIITLVNGSTIRGFSAQKYERLRGPQCHGGWLDELGAWQYPQEAYDMYQFGARLGSKVRTVITTTPKPIPLIREIKDDKHTFTTTGSTYDNEANLAKSFFDQITKYEGTKLGRQEIHAELIDAEETGVVKRSWINTYGKGLAFPQFEFVLTSLDTAFTERTYNLRKSEPDPSAQTVWGVFSGRNGRREVMLLDAWQEYYGLPELEESVAKQLERRWGPAQTPRVKPAFGPLFLSTEGRRNDMLIIEDKGSGRSLQQFLAKRNIVPYMYNPGREDKLTRLHLVSHLFKSGLVWIPESDVRSGSFKTWAEPLVSQLCTYPLCAKDDLMDTCTQALRYLYDVGLIVDKPLEDRRRSSIVLPEDIPNDNVKSRNAYYC